MAAPSASIDEVKRTAVTLVAQPIVLKAARETVARTLDWTDGSDSDRAIRDTIARNVAVILTGLRKGSA